MGRTLAFDFAQGRPVVRPTRLCTPAGIPPLRSYGLSSPREALRGFDHLQRRSQPGTHAGECAAPGARRARRDHCGGFGFHRPHRGDCEVVWCKSFRGSLERLRRAKEFRDRESYRRLDPESGCGRGIGPATAECACDSAGESGTSGCPAASGRCSSLHDAGCPGRISKLHRPKRRADSRRGLDPRKNEFLGRWIKHGGFWPDPKLRLFRRGCGRFEDRAVHETVQVSGATATLKRALSCTTATPRSPTTSPT